MPDITEAVRKALADYLQTQLIATFPTLTVFQDWPVPGRQLPEYALSVLVIGPPIERPHAPVIHTTTPTTSPNGTVMYSYGRPVINLQIDAWSRYAVKRDDLAAAMRTALNRHPADTLGVTGLPRLSRRNGLILKIASMANTPCRYLLNSTMVPVESSAKVQDGEYRATWIGTAETFAVDSQTVPLMKTITVKTSTNGLPQESKTLT